MAINSWCKILILDTFQKLARLIKQFRSKGPNLDYLDEQDISRFSQFDIIMSNQEEVKRLLPDILGQALARAWIDKRFLEAFINYPVEILERGGVFLPSTICVEFEKKDTARPKVTVYETSNGRKQKLLELKLILVAEQ